MPGVLVDYAAGGEPIGLEITALGQVTVEDVNAVLEKLGLGSRWVLKSWHRSLAA
jgi:hypothetical protein